MSSVGAVAVGFALVASITFNPACSKSEELELDGYGYHLPASLEMPDEDGSPCVVFFAGSGPTDRNWLGPLIPGSNGSAQQLAEALLEAGVGSIRFDKVGSGTNMDALSLLSIEHYVDEAELAYRELSSRSECGSIFLLGNSEGSIHVSRTAVRLQGESDFGGLISMAGPSRTMLALIVEQVHNLHADAGDDLAVVDAALAVFQERASRLPDGEGEPIDLSDIPAAQGIWAIMVDPVQGRVGRELMRVDPLEAIRAYHGPMLVMSAENDIQVPISDGDGLFAALPEHPLHVRAVIQNANHVFKAEDRGRDSNPSVLVLAYAEEGRPLADGVVDQIVAFVNSVSGQ